MDIKKKVILASGSPRRRAFLEGMGIPFEVLPASGIAYALVVYILPLVVNMRRKEWLSTAMIFSTKSSSLVVVPIIPLPPRLCAE